MSSERHKLTPSFLRDHVTRSLEEDLPDGDPTTRTIVSNNRVARGRIKSKQNGVLAGRPVVEALLEAGADQLAMGNLDPRWEARDGDHLTAGQTVVELVGSARLLLTIERLLLNYLGELSGVATETSKYVQLAADHGVSVFDTRKTSPHNRRLQKYAVRQGGGQNHRLSLSDGVMVKDNHKLLAGGIEEALGLVEGPEPVVLEIHEAAELDSLRLKPVDVIMLDNFKPQEVSSLLETYDLDAVVEASGGIRRDDIPRYAEAGVDRVSVGALTHSSPSLDLSMGLIDS